MFRRSKKKRFSVVANGSIPDRIEAVAIGRASSDATLSLALIREMEPHEHLGLPPQWRQLARAVTHQDVAEVVLTHQSFVYSAAFSPDGRRIVTASLDKTARVWRPGQPATDGSIPFVELTGHEAAVASGSCGAGAFSPDSTRILTLSDDKTLRIWSAGSHGETAILRLPNLDAYTVSFSPDGTRIVTASHDKRDPSTGKMTFAAIVWPAPPRHLLHAAAYSCSARIRPRRSAR